MRPSPHEIDRPVALSEISIKIERMLKHAHSGCRQVAVASSLLFFFGALALNSSWAGADSPKTIQDGHIVAALSSASQSNSVSRSLKASFGHEDVSPQAQHVANWVVNSVDNQNMPFLIIDKVHAKVMIFDGKGQLLGTAPALLGLAKGDDSSPGIGQRKLSSIRPDERTTPAGRFVASLDRDIHGKEMLWVDYETAISLHPVVKGTPAERRSQRLASAMPDDRRISYGCINVPLKFYETFVSPAFTGTSGIVYILPETRTAQEVFGSYDIKNL